MRECPPLGIHGTAAAKSVPGCAHCYVYRIDGRHGKSGADIVRTAAYDLPLRKSRDGSYKIPPGETVYTCFTSDFLLPEADAWRERAWEMIRERFDLSFVFATKRIDRLEDCLPPDWGEGYPNVRVWCTVENQEMADYRLPFFNAAPVRAKGILCEPLLGPVDLSRHLGAWIDEVIAGGESGEEARVCDYAWVLDLRRQCEEKGVAFHFKQTGARFFKDGRLYRIKRSDQRRQAEKAGIDYGSARPSGGRRRLDQGRIRAGKHILCLRTGAPGCAAWSAKRSKEEQPMKSYRKELYFHLPMRRGIVNITPQVEEALRESGIQEGLVLVNAMNITASVFINDDESGLHHDYEVWLEKLAPRKALQPVPPQRL